MQVLAERRVQIPAGELVLAIIGSSHFIEIRGLGVTLCELLTCPNSKLSSVIGEGKSCAARYSRQLEREKLSYSFNCQRHDLTRQQFDTETAEISELRGGRLVYIFPGKQGPNSALTSLEWQVEMHRAGITTYHTFPDELAIVQSSTVIGFAEAGAGS